MKECILIVEDDKEVRDMVVSFLADEGMTILEHDCGSRVLPTLQKNQVDLLIMDLGLPDIDGLDLLKKIRETDSLLPVLILSARKKTYSKVLGLGLGADDYITKPFSPDELLARVKAHLRRAKTSTKRTPEKKSSYITFGSLKMDLNSKYLFKNNIQLTLSYRLFRLLQFFMENPDQVFSKEQLYNNVWDDTYFDDQTLFVYISELRKLIEDNPSKPEYLKTVRGFGYVFNDPGKE